MHFWYRTNLSIFAILLLPFSMMFFFITKLRRLFYRLNLIHSFHSPVPVIVVGNITVGGTGKTPMVIYITQLLQRHGYRVGVVTRGVGGSLAKSIWEVTIDDKPSLVGDEALLLKTKLQCPIVIGRKRSAAIQHLYRKYPCDVIVSDDGLQHYRMQRDIEIVMIDETRKFGNGCLIPAGPLRESVARLDHVDFVIHKSMTSDQNWNLHYSLKEIFNAQNPKLNFDLTDFPFKKIHAIAAIANPSFFFKQLTENNFDIIPHIFKDHYLLQKKDVLFDDDLQVIMTEKDWVKCRSFTEEHHWVVSLHVNVSPTFDQEFLTLLKEKINGREKASIASCHRGA